MSEWIDASVSLPPMEVDVLCWVKKSGCKQAVATAGLFFDINGSDPIWMGWESEEPFRSTWQVTHWQPLPEPPK